MICNNQTKNVQADGFTGVLLACESIFDGSVILHGPTGCRGHHSAFSERAFPRDSSPEKLNFFEPFYFGQPRIPTTYLDGDDFVFGAREKLVQAIKEVLKRNPSLIAVVNSPGAALIGDNIVQCTAEAGVQIPCAVIEMPAFSCLLAEGYQQGLMAVLQSLGLPAQPHAEKTVALIGLSIVHRHWSGSIGELRRLLALCGIEVVCAVGAGSAVADYLRIPRASCYAVVHDEYADKIVPWLVKQYGGRAVAGALGAPVGFTATEAWVKAVAGALDADPNPALEDIRMQRRHVSRLINQVTGAAAQLKGMSFAVKADPSIALPLVRWLYEYLGMYPVSVEIIDYPATTLAMQLRTWLESIGCGDAWQKSWQNSQPDLLFAEGEESAQSRVTGSCGVVDLMLPVGPCLDVVPKTMLGVVGSAWLIEWILRELSSYFWG